MTKTNKQHHIDFTDTGVMIAIGFAFFSDLLIIIFPLHYVAVLILIITVFPLNGLFAKLIFVAGAIAPLPILGTLSILAMFLSNHRLIQKLVKFAAETIVAVILSESGVGEAIEAEAIADLAGETAVKTAGKAVSKTGVKMVTKSAGKVTKRGVRVSADKTRKASGSISKEHAMISDTKTSGENIGRSKVTALANKKEAISQKIKSAGQDKLKALSDKYGSKEYWKNKLRDRIIDNIQDRLDDADEDYPAEDEIEDYVDNYFDY